jgi:CRISPR-associated endoribonuclease Cas6
MRLKIELVTEANTIIPANYFYPLSAAVYKLLKLGSPEFAEFLHEKGYSLNGKRYKLFSFALRFGQFRFENNYIKLISPSATLFITSPLTSEFIQNFIIGTFERQTIEINNSLFSLSFMETLPEPEITNKMKFSLLSPLVLSTKREVNGRLMPYYFRYTDDIKDINEALINNLRNKYRLINNKGAENKIVRLTWDTNYIENAAGSKKRLTKKQTIKEGRADETEIVGNLLPFTLEGDKELIKTGYDCAFGEKNALGFGYADVTDVNRTN